MEQEVKPRLRSAHHTGVWYEVHTMPWTPDLSPYDTWNKTAVTIYKCQSGAELDDAESQLRSIMQPGFVSKKDVASVVWTHDRKVCVKMYDFMPLADLKDAIDYAISVK